MNFIPIGDGDILFKKDKPPPTSYPGYYQDKDDPYLWHAEWPDCEFRKVILYTKPCGKLGQRAQCTHFRKDINISVCCSCEVPE